MSFFRVGFVVKVCRARWIFMSVINNYCGVFLSVLVASLAPTRPILTCNTLTRATKSFSAVLTHFGGFSTGWLLRGFTAPPAATLGVCQSETGGEQVHRLAAGWVTAPCWSHWIGIVELLVQDCWRKSGNGGPGLH